MAQVLSASTVPRLENTVTSFRLAQTPWLRALARQRRLQQAQPSPTCLNAASTSTRYNGGRSGRRSRGGDHGQKESARRIRREGRAGVTTEPASTVEITRLSAMHMAHVLANVVGAVLTRLPPELQQPMFDLLRTSALESVEQVVSSHPGETKRRVRDLTRLYVTVALHRVAGELGLEVTGGAGPS